MALHRFEHFFGVDPGMAKGMRYEEGEQIDMDLIICETLKEEEHVWVILKEDIALMQSEEQKFEDD